MTVHMSVRNADTNAPRVSWNMGMLELLHMQNSEWKQFTCFYSRKFETKESHTFGQWKHKQQKVSNQLYL